MAQQQPTNEEWLAGLQRLANDKKLPPQEAKSAQGGENLSTEEWLASLQGLSPQQEPAQSWLDRLASLHRQHPRAAAQQAAGLASEAGNKLTRLGQATAHGAARGVASVPDVLGIAQERMAENLPEATEGTRVGPDGREYISPLMGGMASDVRATAARNRSAAQTIREAAPGPEGGSQGYLEQVAEGVGSTAPGLITGLLMGGGGMAARLASTFLVSGAQEGIGAWYEALEATGDEDQAWTALLATGAGGGVLELPLLEKLAGVLKNIDKASGGGLRKALAQILGAGLTEGSTEFAQSGLGDIVAKYISKHDEDRVLFETALDEGLVGVGAGVLLMGLAKGAQRGLYGKRGSDTKSQDPDSGSQDSDTGGVVPPTEDTPGKIPGIEPERIPGAEEAKEAGNGSTVSEPFAGEGAPTPTEGTADGGSVDVDAGGIGTASVQPGDPVEAGLQSLKRAAGVALDRQVEEGAPEEQVAPIREAVQGARIREPQTPDERLVTERFQQRGIPLGIAEGLQGTGFQGVYSTQSGAALLAPQEAGSAFRAYGYHEMAHALNARENGSWEALAAKIEQADPKGFQESLSRATGDREAMGVDLTPEQQADEQVAVYVEGISRWLDGVFQDEARFQAILANDRTLGQRIIDALVQVLRSLGIPLADTRAKRIQALADEVFNAAQEDESGVPDYSPDPEQAIELALAVKEAFDTMLVQALDADTQQDPNPDPRPAMPPPTAARPTATEGPMQGPEQMQGPPAPPKSMPAKPDGTSLGRELEDAREEVATLKESLDSYDVPALKEAARRERMPAEGRMVNRPRDPWRAPKRVLRVDGMKVYVKGLKNPIQRMDLESEKDPELKRKGVPDARDTLGVYEERLNDLLRAQNRLEKLERRARQEMGDDYVPFALTPQFWRWFGDSKVVDENGEPLVVYHGTFAEKLFDAFKGSAPFFEVYFSESPDVASEYAERHQARVPGGWNGMEGYAPRVYPVYLSIQNPLTVSVDEWLSGVMDPVEAAEAGYDGYVIEPGPGDLTFSARTYVAFSPTQIKSALGNRGTYDPALDDIRFAAAYQGTGYGKPFERHDNKYLGTGEGAMAYGWGHYFASLRKVAEFYRKKLSDWRERNLSTVTHALPREMWGSNDNARRIMSDIADALESGEIQNPGEYVDAYTIRKDLLPAYEEATRLLEDRGQLLQVDLAPSEDEYLLWDEPLSKQSEKVRGALESISSPADVDGWFSASQKVRGQTVPVVRRVIENGIAEVAQFGEVGSPGAFVALVNGEEIGEYSNQLEATRAVDARYPDIGRTGKAVYRGLQQDFDSPANAGRTQEMASRALLRAGIRGIKYLDGSSRGKGEGSYNYVIFDPADVTITHRNDEPLFAVSRQVMGGPLPRRQWDAVREVMIEHLTPVERAYEVPGERPIDELNAVMGEKLRRGKSRDRMRRKIIEWHVPIKKQMREMRGAVTLYEEAAKIAGGWNEETSNKIIDLADLYVYGRGAPGRNATAIRRNEQVVGTGRTDTGDTYPIVVSKFGHEENPGSGMRTSKAEALVDFLENHPQYGEQFKRLGEMWDAFTESNLQDLIADELISEQEAEAWRKAFPHYAPARSDLDELNMGNILGGVNMGRGNDIRGREFKPALGRSTLGEHPIAYGFQQSLTAIVRGEKAEVGRRLLNWLRQYSDRLRDYVDMDPDFTRETLVDGKVQRVFDPQAAQRPGVLGFKENGETVWVEFKNGSEPVAKAMRGLGPEMSHALVRYPRMATSFLSAMSTRYNPAFTPFNAIRDIGTAFVNSLEIGTAFAFRVVRPDNIWRAFATISYAERVERAAVLGKEGDALANRFRPFVDERMLELYRRYKAAGGPVSVLDLDSFEGAVKRIEKMTGDVDKTQAGIQKLAIGLRDAFAGLNDAVENMARFSSFVELVESGGATDEQAAVYAKELTVNFEQKGRISPFLNAYWAFSVAGINGMHRALGAVARSRRVQGTVVGMMAFAAMYEPLMRMLMGTAPSGDDWWDLIPEYEKRDYFIIPKLWTGKQDGSRVTIPLPFVFRWFWNVGRQVGAQLDPRGTVDPVEGAWQVFVGAVDEFNPFGGASTPLEVVTPTIGDPLVAISTNRDWAGRQIMPDDFGAGKPLSERYWPDANPQMVEFAKFLNRATGGDEVVPGEIDRLRINSPEIYEELTRFAFGGVGSFLERTWGITQRAVTGEDIPTTQIPVLRRLRREASPYWTDRRFREHTDLIEQIERQIKAADKRGDRGRARQLRAQNRSLLGMAPEARLLKRDLKGLREREKDEGVRERMERKMTRFNQKALEAQQRDGKR